MVEKEKEYDFFGKNPNDILTQDEFEQYIFTDNEYSYKYVSNDPWFVNDEFSGTYIMNSSTIVLFGIYNRDVGMNYYLQDNNLYLYFQTTDKLVKFSRK
jgi:hypothetical protein